MSLGLVPIFQGASPNHDALGEVLAEQLEDLEALAAQASVTPLSAFGDQRQVPYDFDAAPEDLDAVLGPCTDWFEASSGASAVAQLIDVLQRPDHAGAIRDRDAVLEELAALRSCLEKAADAGAKFRLILA